MKTKNYKHSLFFFCFSISLFNTTVAQELRLGLNLNSGFNQFESVSRKDRVFHAPINMEAQMLLDFEHYDLILGGGFYFSQLEYKKLGVRYYSGGGLSSIDLEYNNSTLEIPYVSFRFGIKFHPFIFRFGTQIITQVRETNEESYRVSANNARILSRSFSGESSLDTKNYNDLIFEVAYPFMDDFEFNVINTIRLQESGIGPEWRFLFGLKVFLFSTKI